MMTISSNEVDNIKNIHNFKSDILRSKYWENATEEAASALGKFDISLLHGSVGRTGYKVEAEIIYIGTQYTHLHTHSWLCDTSLPTTRHSCAML